MIRYMIFFTMALCLLMIGCEMFDNLSNSRVDFTDEIMSLKTVKESFLAEKKELTEMVKEVIGKVKSGEVALNDATLLFAKIDVVKDSVARSIYEIDSEIKDMVAKSKKASEGTNVPWWAIFLGNAAFSLLGIKNRTKFGLSEPGYTHKT